MISSKGELFTIYCKEVGSQSKVQVSEIEIGDAMGSRQVAQLTGQPGRVFGRYDEIALAPEQVHGCRNTRQVIGLGFKRPVQSQVQPGAVIVAVERFRV